MNGPSISFARAVLMLGLAAKTEEAWKLRPNLLESQASKRNSLPAIPCYRAAMIFPAMRP